MPFPRRVHRRCIATVLTLSLSALPLPALAGPAEGGDESPEQLYNEGRALYETADYEGAIGLWTKAYAKLEWSPANAEIKAGLLYNLAGAHEEAFGINGQISHLNKALVLLKRFDENIVKIYGEGPDANAERDRVQDRIRRIQGKIDSVQASGGGESGADAELEKAEREAAADAEPEPDPQTDPASDKGKKVGKILMISGGVVAGIGVAAGGAALAFAVRGNQANDFSGIDDTDYQTRLDQIDYGWRMNAIAVTNTVISGVLLAAGITMLAIGAKKNKAEQATTATLAPSFGRGQAGLVLRGRF